MLDYSSFPNTIGSFPSVSGKSSTTPTSGDGTPFSTSFIDDLWGANQALMDRAALTPDGSSETAAASQRMTAMLRCFGAPGEVVMWGSMSDPADSGLRLLLLEGSVVEVSDYPDLVAATWIGASDNNAVHALGGGFVKTSDSDGLNPSPTGTYFKLPDTRGMFPRGLDNGAGHDPDSAYRVIGNRQMDMMVQHEHKVAAWTSPSTNYQAYRFENCLSNGGSAKDGLALDAGTGTFIADTRITVPETRLSDYNGTYSTALWGSETRPMNFAIRFAVRY